MTTKEKFIVHELKTSTSSEYSITRAIIEVFGGTLADATELYHNTIEKIRRGA